MFGLVVFLLATCPQEFPLLHHVTPHDIGHLSNYHLALTGVCVSFQTFQGAAKK